MSMGKDQSVGLDFSKEVSRTKQEFREECDINNVVAKHILTGQFTHLAKQMPAYGDFSNVSDYQTACDQIKQAELNFAQLPAKVRKRMDNDPAVFIAFLENPDNQAEAEELGLVDLPEPSPEELPVPAPVVETPAD